MEKVIETKNLPDGQMKTVVAYGIPIAIAHIGDEYFAVNDSCTHAQCSLGTDGYLTGHTVMCGCHGATFDIVNGTAVTLPATVNLITYSVVVKDGWLYIERKK